MRRAVLPLVFSADEPQASTKQFLYNESKKIKLNLKKIYLVITCRNTLAIATIYCPLFKTRHDWSRN